MYTKRLIFIGMIQALIMPLLTGGVPNPTYATLVSEVSTINTPVEPPSGLVSWWPGNGNADDIVGANQGVMQNGATYAIGLVGQAFSFDGIDDYVVVPDNPSLSPQQFTIDAWVRFDSFYTGKCLGNDVVSKGNDSTPGYYGLRVYDPGISFCGSPTGIHYVQFFIRFSNGSIGTVNSNTEINTGKFYHLAATWDGITIKVYVNGVLDGQADFPGTVLGSNTLPLTIGRHDFLDFPYVFQGLIDEVHLFNRAISASEINSIYLAGSEGLNSDQFIYPMDKAKLTGPKIIEYNIQNGGLKGKSTCFDKAYALIWHTGEDWFAPVDTPVNAVANGIVLYSSKDKKGTTTYKGGVVIIEHTLTDGTLVYSMYAHLDPDKILIAKNESVIKGQKIADGLVLQTYSGKLNVHLHWEIRYFFDGSGILKAPKYKDTCSGMPGPGYTYNTDELLAHPDNFVANEGAGPTYHWTDPSEFVETH